MSKRTIYAIFFAAIFFQAGAYGLTFMLPKLFATFGANEEVVGTMLLFTAIATLIVVYYSGHLADYFGRVATLGIGCIAIAIALLLFAITDQAGLVLICASSLLGAGWGLTYALPPVVLSRLIEDSERVQMFALLSLFVMAGFGLSPVLASVLENSGFLVRDAFKIVAVLSALSGLLFLVLIRPIRALTANAPNEPRSRLDLSNIVAILKSRAVVPVMMALFGASVFAGMANFQTVYAEERGLDYATFFLVYTLAVIACRIVLVWVPIGKNQYRIIAALQYIMASSAVLFLFMGSSEILYPLVAILFAIGYGASYPILVAMAAQDARTDLVPQTLQLFALTYFIGIFGFPRIAGWFIVNIGTGPLLALVAVLAAIEASMALRRSLSS